MFKSALIKLTLLYLLIIMIISAFFTLNIYRISANELNNNIRRQQNNIERMGGFGPGFINNKGLIEARNEILEEARNNLVRNLAYTNLVILVIGGLVSYYFAKRTLKPIEESHEAQMRFASDASHELRSPLAAMKSEIEVALRDPKLSKEEAVSLLKSNLEEVDRLNLLAEGLLGLTKERANISREVVDVEKLIDQAIRVNRKKANEKKIKIVSTIKPDLKVWVNEEEIKELFNIILDNAIKYSEPKKNVDIKGLKAGNYAEIKIKDQGVGINESDLPHIFDRFYRADQSRTKTDEEGYGLGLSIAKKIIELNEGEVEAKSTSGKGSEFIIRLPLANMKEK